jgi:periplasmic divalent cation tolerance protein
MSPYPLDPVHAVGPMRLVVSTYPSRESAFSAVDAVLARRLAACANVVPIDSRYWWKGKIESADESLVVFKTVPKRVGGLLRLLKESHPYSTPEIIEVDVPRVDAGYLRYLLSTLDPAGVPPPPSDVPRRPAGRRGRATRDPAQIRARHRRPSR